MTPAGMTFPIPRTAPAPFPARPSEERELGSLLFTLRAGLNGFRSGRFGALTPAQQHALQEMEDACAAALLRLSDQPAPAIVECGGLRMDRTRRRLTVDGRELRLTRTEFDLLWRLLSQAGRTVAYEELARLGWGIPDGGSAIIKQHVSRLKSKVEAALGRPWPVRNIRSAGYLLE